MAMDKNYYSGPLNSPPDRLDYSGLSNIAGQTVPSRTPVDRIAMALSESREVSARVGLIVSHLVGTKPESEACDSWGSGIPASQGDEAQRYLIDRAAMIAGFYDPGDIMGYVVLAWDKHGNKSVAYHVNEKSVVGMTMVPSFAADAIRRRMLEDGDW